MIGNSNIAASNFNKNISTKSFFHIIFVETFWVFFLFPFKLYDCSHAQVQCKTRSKCYFTLNGCPKRLADLLESEEGQWPLYHQTSKKQMKHSLAFWAKLFSCSAYKCEIMNTWRTRIQRKSSFLSLFVSFSGGG